MEHEAVQQAYSTEKLLSVLKECDGFDINYFMKLMVSRIPKYNGFDAADAFMRSMLSHIEELSVDAIREIMRTYKNNSQCINRARNSSDLAEVKKYLETKTENEDNSEVSEE